MPPEPNAPALIVRHDPTRPDAAILETRRILERIGEPDAIVRTTDVPGNLKVIPEGNPHEAQEAITHLANERPHLFRLTANWTVVDTWVPTDLAAIQRAVAGYQRDLARDDSYRVAVRPSSGSMPRDAIIDAVAGLLADTAVDLENPSKEIRIDILGEETGVGLVGRDELFPGAQRRDPSSL